MVSTATRDTVSPLLTELTVTAPAEPRMFRYTLHPIAKQTSLTKLRVLAIREWVHLILGADGH